MKKNNWHKKEKSPNKYIFPNCKLPFKKVAFFRRAGKRHR